MMPLPLCALPLHALALTALLQTPAGVDPPPQPTFTTLFKSTLGLEGLTADRRGRLHAAARGGDPCPVYRLGVSGGTAVVVGNIPAPCSPSGLAFNAAGDLFVADGDEVLRLTPSEQTPPTATVFVAGVPGANGVAFDRRGNLWVSDGTTGQGRVWRVTPGGVSEIVFRIQPMANQVNVVESVGGTGRDVRSLPPGAVTFTPTSRNAANTLGSQPLVANGLAFDEDGDLFVADTARGAIWKAEFDRQGALRSRVGCDSTFVPNTLCLDNVFVAHPYLEGADGIALDRAGNIWTAANERNAIVVVTRGRRVREFFRNEADEGSAVRSDGPLEFPTSPFLVGRRLCLTHSDGNRRDNVPNTGGEVGPDVSERAKISCLDQLLDVRGLPLPVR
jgi:sugar lactone lactonase YvrE